MVCLFGITRCSQKIITDNSAKNITDHEMSTLLVKKDKIIHQIPRMRDVYNFTYHIDNEEKIVYIIPENPEKLQDEVDELRMIPVGTSNSNDQTKSEKQFALVSAQIAKKYGSPWKVQVLNTSDPIFDDLQKSDILWEFHNGKEHGKGSQGKLFKLERLILTPFDYLANLVGIIILGAIGWFIFSIIGSGSAYSSSYSRAKHAGNEWHQPNYGNITPNKNDDYVTETHYDQYGNAHSVKFKKGDYSRGSENGRTFNMNPNGSYDSDDGNTHFDS